MGKYSDNEETRNLLREYFKNRDRDLREKLILQYEHLVSFLVKRFSSRGESEEDLQQVARIGLIQAIDRFDPSRDIEFISFATPTISGELRRYFRDKGWTVRIPRKLQELNREVAITVEKLTQSFGRSPNIDEISAYLNTPKERILESMELAQAYNPISLNAAIFDAEDGSFSTLMDITGETDIRFEILGEKGFLKDAISVLTPIEKKVLFYRFYKNLTQVNISRQINISQMQVSRILNTALRKMRHYTKKVMEK